jgi:hypothetical protein
MPAASDVVAHATAEGCWRSCDQHRQSDGSRGEFDAELRRKLMDFSTLFFTLVPALDRNG